MYTLRTMSGIPDFLAALTPAPAPAPVGPEPEPALDLHADVPAPAPAGKPVLPEQLHTLFLTPQPSVDALAQIKAFAPQYEIPTGLIAQICDRGPDASYSAEAISELRKLFGLTAPEPVELAATDGPRLPPKKRRKRSDTPADGRITRAERLAIACSPAAAVGLTLADLVSFVEGAE